MCDMILELLRQHCILRESLERRDYHYDLFTAQPKLPCSKAISYHLDRPEHKLSVVGVKVG